ncbi:hypothetical protein HJC23_005590 [Cyclotella cryptica]|uniref:Sulfotransferase n=1 Tax=Cyclotella cryptica TaxID=29204 RepID=A0ABD3PQW8_9STRA
MESNHGENLLNTFSISTNNNEVSTSNFTLRFLRNRNKLSPQQPNFVSVIILIALFGLTQLYFSEKTDESVAKQMVLDTPVEAIGTAANDNTDDMNNKNLTSESEEPAFSHCQSPYEQIWVNSQLPSWAKKQPELRDIENDIPPNERICFVHVGKTGGSSIGCSLGFSLHCTNSSRVMGGLLPRRTTRLFHADTYDCFDDSAYFMFVVRDPVRRIQSDFLYERPLNERILKKYFPEYFQNRKSYYLDCPFRTMEDVVRYGLLMNSTAREECKMRAYTALWGTKHFACHHYFNYQFHLEGLPKDARILVIRNEHMVQDWNTIEHFIGGQKDIIPLNVTLDRMNVNRNPQAERDKHLSPASRRIVCAQLCNEIVNYKKILRLALNLDPSDVRQSMNELRLQCPEMADVEEGECELPMPDIRNKLVNNRGYRVKT